MNLNEINVNKSIKTTNDQIQTDKLIKTLIKTIKAMLYEIDQIALNDGSYEYNDEQRRDIHEKLNKQINTYNDAMIVENFWDSYRDDYREIIDEPQPIYQKQYLKNYK